MTKILDALRSPGAMMIALVLALFPQGEHTAQVFMHFSHDASSNAQLFAYAFAAAVEVAVLLFVLAGHRGISYTFAAASFLTNIVYYAIGGVALLSVAVMPVLLLSALLPGCIMGYSHTIAQHTAIQGAQPATQPARRWQWFRRGTKSANAPAMPTETPRNDDSGKNKEMDAAAAAAVSTPVFAPVAPDVADDALTAIAQQDARAAALQMASEGCSVAQIAAQVDAKPATVRSWIARDKAKRNGGTHA